MLLITIHKSLNSSWTFLFVIKVWDLDTKIVSLSSLIVGSDQILIMFALRPDHFMIMKMHDTSLKLLYYRTRSKKT